MKYNWIQSRCFYSKNLLSSQRIGPHSIDVLSVLLGNLLGDAWAEKRSNSTRIHINMSNRNVEYLFWLYNFYRENGYCSDKKPKLNKQIGKKGQIYFSFKFRTFSFSSLNWLYDGFYCSGIKKVPQNISELLTARALAIWFMDDGSACNSGVKISTQGFSHDDLILLQKALVLNFGLTTTLHRHGGKKVLYFSKIQAFNMLQIIKPYLITNMLYKFKNLKTV